MRIQVNQLRGNLYAQTCFAYPSRTCKCHAASCAKQLFDRSPFRLSPHQARGG